MYHRGVSLPSENSSRKFGALADSNRFSILQQLRSGEWSVGELCKETHLPQSLMSFHLKVLREAGLLRSRRDGRTVWYSIDPDGMAQLKRLVALLGPGEHAGSEAARDADLELCLKYINVR